MQHRTPGLLAFILQCITTGLALAFVVTLLWPAAGDALRQRLGVGSPPAAVPAPQIPPPAAPPATSWASAVERAAPAVINIYANKIVTERRVRVYPDPLMQRLFGGIAFGPAYQRHEQSLGSGVIFSDAGYVLTNNHVIAGADEIQVLLWDNRVANATVVGTDPLTDLAVLHISADDLPTIAVAHDRELRVGDLVLAIGNPFGIGQTVTMGIVSGLQRQLDNSAYENFIQTDAAINSGNSGGALVNARGELVGINTAMLGRDSGAEGIGFAIPVGTAELVMQEIIAHGHVARGWIGADYRALPPDAGAGVQVVNVYARSPAAAAGLQPGDVLRRLNGEAISGAAWLLAREASARPGTRVRLDGLRRGAAFHVELELAQRPAPGNAAAGRGNGDT